MTAPLIVHDEYDGDGTRTDWPTLAKVTPFAWAKCDEGMGSSGNEQHFAWARDHAHAAGMKIGAYDWPIFATAGAPQADLFLAHATGADAYGFDLERGDQIASSLTKTNVLTVAQDVFDRFHERMPDAVAFVYGASLLADLGITWPELVGPRDYLYAWLPRYSGGGDIRTWTTQQIVQYAHASDAYRASVPLGRLAMVQFTDGTFGPAPHTLNGLNRNEDLSVVLLPDVLLGSGNELANLTTDQQDQLAGMLFRLHQGGAIPPGSSDAFKAGHDALDAALDFANTHPTVSGGVTQADIAAAVKAHADKPAAHEHRHGTGGPTAPPAPKPAGS